MVGIPDSIVKKTLTDQTYYIDVVICGVAVVICGGEITIIFSHGFATPLL